MFSVEELLHHKTGESGPDIMTIAPGATVLDAAQMMNTRHIGALVVMDGERIGGILTERDVMTRLVAKGKDAASTRVSAVMTERVLTCTPATSLDDVRRVMRSKRIRHLPVVDEGRLAGMVSIGDLNIAEAETLSETIKYLEAYMTQG